MSNARRAASFVLLLAVAQSSAACLVLSINPVYDGDSMSWDPALVGEWQDADDKASLQIQAGEWRSYKIHYAHPIETGDLTGYLTAIDDARYLDVMPARGEDRGSFLIPVHAVVRVRIDGDRLELTPLSYDWFFDRIRAQRSIPGLAAVLDQKDNAMITSSALRLREWLRLQPAGAAAFGAAATFTRKAPASWE